MEAKRLHDLIEDAYDSIKSVSSLLSNAFDIEDQQYMRRSAVRAKLVLKRLLSTLEAEKARDSTPVAKGQNVVDFVE